VDEAGQTKGGCGRVRKDDKALGRSVAYLSVRVVGRNGRPQMLTAGGEAGGQTQVGEAAAVVDGRVLGFAEEVFDGLTSVLELRNGRKRSERRPV
jgi:hypothetical protein